MSKIKEQLLREEENTMEYYVGFMEWLDKYQSKPTLSDLDICNMEEDSLKSSTVSNVIVSASALKPVNNRNYQPKRGEQL